MPRRTKRKSKPKRRTRIPSPEWYEIEQILDERVSTGKTEYLIDWAGTDENGNRWAPTWEQEVTPDEIEKWELKKKGVSAQNEPVKRTRPPDDSDDDEPIPPPKRRKARQLEIPSKEPTSSLPSLEPESELATPATEYSEQFTPPRNQRISVTIKDPAIDRSEYLSISTTQTSSQLISELEEEDNRVVIVSEFSLGTIPDSQDITTDSWPQPQLILSPEAPEVSRSQGNIATNISESSLVIPDSQDLSTNPSAFEPIVSPGDDLSSRNQVTPEQTQQEIVPDTVTAEIEIPSRQPEQSSPPPRIAVENHELSATASGPPVDDQRTRSSLAPATHRSPSPDPGLTEPVFLTQVPASLELPSLQSTGESRVLESSRDKLNATSIDNQESIEDNQASLLPNSNPSESQAAQVVTYDFELLYESPINCYDTGSKVRRSDTPLSTDSLTTQNPVEGKSGQSALTQTSPLTLSKPSSQTRTRFRMEGSSRPSAADQIRMAFGSIDPDIEDAIVRRPAVTQSQVEPFMGADIGVTSINPSVTIQPPNLHDESDLPSHNGQWNTGIEQSDQFLPPDSISPASLIKSPSRSVAHGLLELVDKSFEDSGPSIASTLMPDLSSLPPTTVSPAEISNSIDPGELGHTIPPLSDNGTTSSRLEGSSGQSITMGQVPDEHDFDEPSSPIQPERVPLQYLITLPFQASMRPVYDDLVAKYRPDAETFSGYFSRDTVETPSESLVGRIDEFLSKLTNVCDYPQHLVGTSLEELPTSKQAKYVRDANSKFNFVFELLKDIHKMTEILIVAGTPELLRILFSITEDLELDCTANSIGRTSSEFQGSAVRIQLILGTEEHDPFQYDVVIGFDHAFHGSLVAKSIGRGTSSSRPPLILQLLTTHSIEHIAVHINSDLSSMERRNALLLGIAKARKLVQDPDEDREHEPHTAAQVFSEYLNDITPAIQWEPRSIPDDVLDIFVNSQYRSQGPQDTISQGIGFKHKLVDDDSNGENAKRIRLGPSEELSSSLTNPPIPDSVRMLLRAAESKAATHKLREAKMRVSIASMMVVAEQVAELERQSEAKKNETELRAGIISELEKQTKDYERTANKQADSWRKALEDRHNFEKEKQKIESAMKTAQEAGEQETLRSRKLISGLNERIATLTASPEGSEESVVGKLDRLLKEAQEKIKVLERRLENANNDSNYVRDEYQKATSRAGALNSENKELRETNEELTKKASENLTKIQEIQRDQTIKEHLKTIEVLRTQLKEKDVELEQLRVLKNGRPQTRQASVPRSPRTSMMSPRTGRFGSSASRGTSPAPAPGYDGNGSGGLPGMQYMSQQPGNGRWGHLRD